MMRLSPAALVFAPLLLCLACSPGDEVRVPAARASSATPDSIVLERTVCFGHCPAYRLRVAADGALLFQPRSPAGESVTDTISASAFVALAAELENAGFYSFPTTIQEDAALCAREATDHPSATLTVYRAAEAKSVHDYAGCSAAETDAASAARLEALRKLQARVDTVTRSARWARPVEFR